MGWWLWVTMAWAGSGPWVPGTGSGSLYLGVSGQQFRRLTGTLNGQPQDLEVGEGLAQVSAQGVLTYGIAPRVELEASLPAHFIHVLREDADLCMVLGDEACDPVRTVGTLRSHVKWLVLDEVSGAPLSLSVGGVARLGALVAPHRDKLTNAGEGTIDGGALLSLGKSGALGQGGYWSAYTDVVGLYRVPNTTSFPLLAGDRSVPGSEMHAVTDVLFAPKGLVAFGPAASFLWRPSGVDYGSIQLADIDRFSALRVAHLAAGAKVIFRDPVDNAIVVGLYRTVWAMNNPADQFTVSLGVSLNRIFDREER